MDLHPTGVPKLRKLIAEVYCQMIPLSKDVEPKKICNVQVITGAAKGRLAYWRLLIHLNQLKHEQNKGTRNLAPPHFRTTVEEDLAGQARYVHFCVRMTQLYSTLL
ncbi:hypothetical protein Pst134EA_018993 [Puccinia striiformis f. sp. tritici]|uniref:hypothetical protein n=1 Tax=Puccinia striiformis f. sp. tritici TaxID=168172 RepID=UPI0020082A76|nr:hypothetical protein Pst134EA_018993 [Puccinia striiformis f. sp. tritici]KAH9458838.1 hypothetical protein Pst134EA_018993 [Puccinia striiformis f. sp. tritici]KAI9625711.1 hypothetical protein KEM48_010778 [Puccinia striiformis f. sp. tritici PST-130]